MNGLLLHSERRWVCPNCPATAVSRDGRVLPPAHPCRGLRGLAVPMVPEGVRCQVVAVDREDYVGSEDVQRDGDGRPVMAIITTRDDGQDARVLLPCATFDRNEFR